MKARDGAADALGVADALVGAVEQRCRRSLALAGVGHAPDSPGRAAAGWRGVRPNCWRRR